MHSFVTSVKSQSDALLFAALVFALPIRFERTTCTRLAARGVLALACSGLSRGARGELRRTIEASVITTYFQDHPIEFARLNESPRQGFATDPKKPLTFATFREFSYYANYAGERLEREPSGLAAEALTVLTTEYGNVSAAVKIPRFRGHPNWRENAPGVDHGQEEAEA